MTDRYDPTRCPQGAGVAPRLASLAVMVSLGLLLWSPAPISAEGVTAQGTASQAENDAGAAPEAVADTNDEGSGLPFDPAEVGLPGLPSPLHTPADIARVLQLIEQRIAELRAPEEPAANDQLEEGAPAEATDRDAAGQNDTGDAADADDPVAAEDPRIAPLESLQFMLERRAALAEQIATLERSAALEQAQLARLETDGIGNEAPIPITRLDALKAERALAEAKEGRAQRRLASAQTQLDARERNLRQAQRVRRDARDALAESTDEDRPETMLALEVARLGVLLAVQGQAAAEAQVALARAEDELAELEQARLTAELDLVGGEAVLTEANLRERLTLLDERADALSTEIDNLRRRGDLAEARLYRARKRLEQAATDAERRTLAERVAALDAQAEGATAAIEYLQRAITSLRGMRTLWERRYTLMTDTDAAEVDTWYEANRAKILETRDATDDLEVELNAIRGAQLTLARRLGEPDLESAVQSALRDREQAATEVERAARRLLETQNEFATLAQRVQEQLEPLVRERSMAMRWQQTQEQLLGWWHADMLVVEDQAIRVREGVIALVVFCVVVAGIWIFKLVLRRALARREPRTQSDQQGGMRLLLSAVSRHTTQVFILILAFYAAMDVSGLAGAKLESWLWTLLVLALYLQVGLWVNAAVVDYFQRRRSRLEQLDPSAATGYGLLLFFLRVGIWIVVGVSALAYFKYPIAGLIGALGVGGIAVGLAVQNILGDIFSSMAIVLDKPVRVGDFIRTGEELGTVEHIGVKTTRIRSISGEQIVLSNTDLLSSRVHNFKRFAERRVVFQIGVVYQTPRRVLERIPGMLREAVDEQAQVRFDRANFTEFGAFSLDFEVVYFVLSPDFALYRDIQQAINFAVHRRFEEAGIDFAYPTQELILRRGPSLPG